MGNKIENIHKKSKCPVAESERGVTIESLQANQSVMRLLKAVTDKYPAIQDRLKTLDRLNDNPAMALLDHFDKDRNKRVSKEEAATMKYFVIGEAENQQFFPELAPAIDAIYNIIEETPKTKMDEEKCDKEAGEK